MQTEDVNPRPQGARRRWSRRSLFRGGLAAAAGVGATAALSGCGSQFGAGIAGTTLDPGTVSYWNLFTGGDGGRMQTMESVYVKEHGPGSMQAATFTWGNPYYTKLSLATVGGEPPDVAISHLTRMLPLASADLLAPITPEVMSAGGLSGSDFRQEPWDQGVVNGQHYCIPLDTHPFVLYYHTDICRKAGLLDSNDKLKPIVGTDQWQAALEAIKKVTGAYGASVSTVGDTSTSWRWFTTLYHQQDGATPWLSDGGTKLTYNEDLVIKTLTYIQSLTKSGLMPANVDYAGAETLLFTGKAGFYLEGEWEITTFESVKGLKFGMQPVPKFFDKEACQADSHTFVLPRKHRTDAQLKLAMGFIKTLLGQSMTWAQGGHIPAYLPVFDSQAYKALEPQHSYASAAANAVYDAPAWYSGSGSNFENIVGAQIGLVQQGLATPQAALRQMRSQLLQYANTPSPL